LQVSEIKLTTINYGFLARAKLNNNLKTF
jgi:hypothetical protein